MFSFLKDKGPEEERKRARAAFERVVGLRSDSREARSARIRMGLLCRAHLDKTFIAGAELTAAHQELAAAAARSGKEAPELPRPSEFQKVRSGDRDLFVYLPEEYAEPAFMLGARYQRAEISPRQAIEAMQSLADRICLYELRLDEPFQALQFLREELSAQDSSAGEDSGGPEPAAPRTG